MARLRSNLINQMALYGFSHIVPVVLIPFLINTIGLERCGLVNFAIAFTFFAQVLVEFGFDLSSVSLVVDNREDTDKLSRIYSTITVCKIINVVIIFAVYLGILYFVPVLREYTLFYIIAFFRSIMLTMEASWFFRAMEEIKFITRITVPVKFILTVPIFIIVRNPDDFIWVMVLFGCESCTAAIITNAFAIRHYKLHLHIPSITELRQHYVHSTPYFISTLLMRLYSNGNTVLIKFIAGDLITGIYSTAEKLYFLYTNLAAPVLTQVLYPYFQRVKNFAIINRTVIKTIMANFVLIALMAAGAQVCLPFVIHENVTEITHYFFGFLCVIAFYVPAEILGFPYLGLISSAREVNRTTMIASSVYLIGAAIVVSTGATEAPLLIALLGVTCISSLLVRMARIRHYLKGKEATA